MLSQLSINEFVAKLAQADGAPGGGSAAAVAGLMGASLLKMAVDYSLQSPKLAGQHDLLTAQLADLSRLHIELTTLIDRDALALRGLLAAAALPAPTLKAEQVRAAAMQKSLRQAAEAPLETAKACLEVIEIGQAIISVVDKLVISDLMAGVAAANAGITGGLLSTAINLSEIDDESLVSVLKDRIYLLKTVADELNNELESKVYGSEPFSALRE